VYTRVDDATGSATFTNRTHDAEYACALVTDHREGGYDCIADPELGGVVTAGWPSFCLNRQALDVHVGQPGTELIECTYDCARTR
jgi:hypothetical protein